MFTSKFILAATYYQAKKIMPFDGILAKCDGGYMWFIDNDAYTTWKRQK